MLTIDRSTDITLAKIATQAIVNAITSGGPRSGSAPTCEVSAVKALVLDGFDDIAAGWMPQLGRLGRRLDLTSVFTHGQPQVKSSAGRCELADLLIVIDDCAADGAIRDRRAVLVQAKPLKGPMIKLTSKGDRVQYKLLSGWPSFTFVDGAYDRRKRDFKSSAASGEARLTGEYGAIDLIGRPRTWTQLLTNGASGYDGDHELGDYLVRMVTGVDAYGRPAIAGGLDDWSFTVDELMRVAGSRGIKKGSANLRANPNIVAMLTSEPGGEGGDAADGVGEDDDWAGLSFVRLAMSNFD